MTATNELQTDLEQDEGLRLYVYDDANGQPIGPGSHVIGHPTIGIGRALDVHGITKEEATYLLGNDIESIGEQIEAAIPWIGQLDDARAEVLVEMAFNLGINGLLQFKNTLADVKAGNYAKAADEMLESRWASQVGKRAKRLAEQMRTGVHA
jgi:lysozyme